MQNEIFKMLKDKFHIEVFEIKYVDLKKEVSVTSKVSGFKGFAEFALKILGKK